MRRADWFPPEEHEPFRQCWDRGDSVADIRERFNLSDAQVGHRREHLGLPPRRPRSSPSQSWSEARIEALKEGDARGDSASQIAAALNRLPPLHLRLTRNAVIGKLNRMQGGKTHVQGYRKPAWNRGLRLPERPKPPKPGEPARKPSRGVFRAWAEAEAAAAEAAMPQDAVPFLELAEGQCRWVLNDPKAEDALACGRPTIAKTHDGAAALPKGAAVYCRHHFFKTLDLTDAKTCESAMRVGSEGDEHGQSKD